MTKATANQILEILEEGEPLRAKEIAARAGVDATVVNRALYGALKGKVRRREGFRWGLEKGPTRSPAASPASPPAVKTVGRRAGPVERGSDVEKPRTGNGSATRLREALEIVAKHTRREINLTQLLMFLRIGEAGEQGIDAGRLTEDVGASAASTSRTMRILGAVHYNKKQPGFGLVEIEFDPSDNRRRVVKLSRAGRVALYEVLAALR